MPVIPQYQSLKLMAIGLSGKLWHRLMHAGYYTPEEVLRDRPEDVMRRVSDLWGGQDFGKKSEKELIEFLKLPTEHLDQLSSINDEALIREMNRRGYFVRRHR